MAVELARRQPAVWRAGGALLRIGENSRSKCDGTREHAAAER